MKRQFINSIIFLAFLALLFNDILIQNSIAQNTTESQAKITLQALPSNLYNNSSSQDFCKNPRQYYEAILKEVRNKNPYVINNLPDCLKQNRDLIFNVLLIDYHQFQNASDILHQDKVFIKRAIKASPEILKYVAPEVRADSYFMEDAIYINRDALQYCSWSLLDNKLFMQRMIDLDSDNYRFASDRLKSFADFARPALEDNGLLLEFAPPNVKANKDFVKIAITSNRDAIKFANPKIALDPEIIKLAEDKEAPLKSELLEKFLQENYTKNHIKKNLGYYIANKGKFFKKNQLIDRNFVVKWITKYNLEKMSYGNLIEEWSLNPVERRNYKISWEEDFKKYPELVKKIEKFFAKRRLPPEIISELGTTYLWKIKDDPLTLAFNLYSLSPSMDQVLANQFSNITSITAIAQLQQDKWQLSVVDVIFNREVKIDALYENGHKRFILWDLYKSHNKDSSPKLIFKVEDSLNDHFEIFQEQPSGKYRKTYQSKFKLPNF